MIDERDENADTKPETQKAKELRRDEAWKSVMATAQGRTVVADILADLAGTGKAFGRDPLITAYALGRVEAGIDLREKTRKISDYFFDTMERENR